MWFFLFLMALAILAIGVVVTLATAKPDNSTVVVEEEWTPRKHGRNLGSPLFSDAEKKEILAALREGDWVWLLTPFGPQRMEVTTLTNTGREAYLRNAEFEAIAYLDPQYLSQSVAARFRRSSDKLGRSRGAWRLDRILHLQTPTIPKNDPRWDAANRHWVQEEVDGDLFDAMVFYLFLFEGFDQPYTYYEMYEPPVFEEPAVVEEPEIIEEPAPEEPEVDEPVPPGEDPAVEDTQDIPAVPAEVNEETFEPVEPAPEPEPAPERNWGGYDTGPSESFDSGSSYDSGGSDFGGGGDDW